MKSPFPGMAPYLEHPSLWPDVHNQLIAAIADDLSERVAPQYYVGLERRTYLLKADDVVFIGRPYIAMASTTEASIGTLLPVTTSVTVLEVDVSMQDEVSENFLEIHEVKMGKLITILELRSLFELKGKAADKSVDIYFGPQAPAGHAGEWIKTSPGKGWFVYFRIYGPEQPAFDSGWKPGDFEEVK